MPLFSEHIANMYYGSSSPYTGLPYSYSSSVSPLGSSYSASYLSPGGSYNNHSSLSSYSRAPLSSRWITSAGRNYSPMLSTISERGSASPVRINSPRRIPISSRTYGTPTYTPRPVNINTADIDVSIDRYRHKVEPPTPPPPSKPEPEVKPEVKQLKTSSNEESENGPFMPRVDGKPETGIDSSPGEQRGTIKRGRTVVRLYTIKRNSPRKPNEESQNTDTTQDQEAEQSVDEDTKTDEKEFMKWREKLSDDLTYKDKKEKKTLGAKLVEKFQVKENNEKDLETTKVEDKKAKSAESLPSTPAPNIGLIENKLLDRRCSMELLAEQANVLDSLIRSENLSTATLDLSKVGITANNNIEKIESIKRRKKENLQNPLKTTKSDYSLHDSLKSYKDVRNPGNFSKRHSIKKSSSGSSIRRLDSITEFPKELTNIDLPAIQESRLSKKQDSIKQKPKPKLKAKITGSVEVSAPVSPLKFRVENVTVEEKPRVPRKEITYSSEVMETPNQFSQLPEDELDKNHGINKIKKKPNVKIVTNDPDSPEPADGNFWDKIGKRETVYLLKRKRNLDEAKEKQNRALFWFPEEEEVENGEIESNNISESNTTSENDISFVNSNLSILSANTSEDVLKDQIDNIPFLPKLEQEHQEKDPDILEIVKELKMINDIECMGEDVSNIIPDLGLDDTKQNAIVGSILCGENKIDETSCKVSVVSQECKNIGKSSSLDTIDETKIKKYSQKKTKSEKSKNIVKPSKKTDIELKPLLPKHSKKLEEVENHKLSKNSENMTESHIKLGSKIDVLENLQKDVNEKTVDEPIKNEINKESLSLSKNSSKEQKSPVYKHSVRNETIEVLQNNIPKANSEEIKIMPTVENPDNAMKINTDTPMQEPVTSSSSSNMISSKNIEQRAKAKLSESNAPDIEENRIIHKKLLPEITTSDSKIQLPNIDNADKDNNTTSGDLTNIISVEQKIVNSEVPKSNKMIAPVKCSPEVKSKPTLAKNLNKFIKSNKTEDNKEPAISLSETTNTSSNPLNISQEGSASPVQQLSADLDNSQTDPSLHETIKTIEVPDTPTIIESQNIPNKETELNTELRIQTEEISGEKIKAENTVQKDEHPETSNQGVVNPPAPILPKKPVKEEKALRPLIATPRPLQKKAPQVIHSSDSSDSSSEEESSDEDDDEEESDDSEGSAEFYECDNNPDGRTSTGSNDSGFDSSAPASPATFSQIKKDCDVNCHRKCEKLTANLCGVNQRLLVEALASRTASRKGGEAPGTSSGAAPAHCNNTDILEQELEQSTAYDIFRKTGRFTPPARSIPRFRKYTVEDFQFIKVLGKGSFGKVLLAELRDTEYYYAVKCLKKDVVLEDDDVECTLIERKVLALGTNHPYLCHLFATFQTDSHLFFVMEYLNGGDLMFHIQQSGRFPEVRARFYAAEIVSGLKFLHKRGIVYRDLKLDNILLDYEGHVRIADFGMCKLQIYLDKTADTFCGTPDYMAPEIIKGLKYNQTVDWWSFGVLLYEMLIGQSPFSGCDEDELFWSICNEMPSYPRFLSHEALTILTRLLDKDARTRLGGTECMHGEIRDQDFFHAIHWDRLERRELEAPFRPRVRHPMDTQYFDRAFTGERPRLTAVEPHVLRSMDQEPFRGFSYTNPNTTDR